MWKKKSGKFSVSRYNWSVWGIQGPTVGSVNWEKKKKKRKKGSEDFEKLRERKAKK